MSKQTDFIFDHLDWLTNPNVRRCSRAARGMWVDMLALMFGCEDRGVLSTGGVPWTDEEIAAASGGDISDGLSCIEELLQKGVAHRTSSGAVFCKWMVLEEHEKQLNRERVGRHRKRRSNANVTDDVTVKKRKPNDHTLSQVSPSGNNSTPEAESVSRGESEGGGNATGNANVTDDAGVLGIYHKCYPYFSLSIIQQEELVVHMLDAERAKKALRHAAVNNVKPWRISTMVQIYDNRDWEKNGSRKPSVEDNDEFIRSLGNQRPEDRPHDL